MLVLGGIHIRSKAIRGLPQGRLKPDAGLLLVLRCHCPCSPRHTGSPDTHRSLPNGRYRLPLTTVMNPSLRAGWQSTREKAQDTDTIAKNLLRAIYKFKCQDVLLF